MLVFLCLLTQALSCSVSINVNDCGNASDPIFGYAYNLRDLSLTPGQFVSFDHASSSPQVSFLLNSTFKVLEAGLYRATYGASIASSTSSAVTMQLLLRRSDNSTQIIPGSAVSAPMPGNIFGETLWQAGSGDEVALQVNSPGSITLSQPSVASVAPVVLHSQMQTFTNSTLLNFTVSFAVRANSSIYVGFFSNGQPLQVVPTDGTGMVDNQGGIFTRAAFIQNTAYPNNMRTEIWYRDNVAADLHYSIAVHPTGALDMIVQVIEFAGTYYGNTYSSVGTSTSSGAQTLTPSLTLGLRPRASSVFVMVGSANPLPHTQIFAASPRSTQLISFATINSTLGASGAGFLGPSGFTSNGNPLALEVTATNSTLLTLAVAVSVQGADVSLTPDLARNAYFVINKI